MLYEHRKTPPITHRAFIGRLARHAAAAFGLMLLSLVIGMAGYEHFENLEWRDAFLNAAMLLGGMGPVNAPVSSAGKLFAGLYALYAGLVFLIGVAFIFTPILHRLLHTFHWSEKL